MFGYVCLVVNAKTKQNLRRNFLLSLFSVLHISLWVELNYNQK